MENPIGLPVSACRVAGCGGDPARVAVPYTAPRPVTREHARLNFPARWVGLVNLPDPIGGFDFVSKRAARHSGSWLHSERTTAVFPTQVMRSGGVGCQVMKGSRSRISVRGTTANQTEQASLLPEPFAGGLGNRRFPNGFSHGSPSSRRHFP